MVKKIAPGEGDEIVLLSGEAVVADDDVVQVDVSADDKLPKRAIRERDENGAVKPFGWIKLPLLVPQTLKVQKAGGTVSEQVFTDITLHRMTGADLTAISASSPESQLATSFTRSTRLNPAIASKLFQKLDGTDAADASAIVGFFFSSGGRTGR